MISWPNPDTLDADSRRRLTALKDALSNERDSDLVDMVHEMLEELSDGDGLVLALKRPYFVMSLFQAAQERLGKMMG